jgi:hypothetical protein
LRLQLLTDGTLEFVPETPAPAAVVEPHVDPQEPADREQFEITETEPLPRSDAAQVAESIPTSGDPIEIVPEQIQATQNTETAEAPKTAEGSETPVSRSDLQPELETVESVAVVGSHHNEPVKTPVVGVPEKPIEKAVEQIIEQAAEQIVEQIAEQKMVQDLSQPHVVSVSEVHSGSHVGASSGAIENDLSTGSFHHGNAFHRLHHHHNPHLHQDQGSGAGSGAGAADEAGCPHHRESGEKKADASADTVANPHFQSPRSSSSVHNREDMKADVKAEATGGIHESQSSKPVLPPPPPPRLHSTALARHKNRYSLVTTISTALTSTVNRAMDRLLALFRAISNLRYILIRVVKDVFVGL